jgi:hypothetical protein
MPAEPKPMINVQGHPVFDPKFLSEEATLSENANKYVYHYTRWERLLDIAQSGFRLGPLTSMNDPRESKDWYFSTGGPPPAPDMESLDKLDKAVANYRTCIRIGSFTRDNAYGDERNFGRRGYGHPRMWAQYAGNHTGVCIVFDRHKLDAAIRQRYPVEQDAWVKCGEVEYIESSLQEPTNLVIHINKDQDINIAVKDYFATPGFGSKVFFTKHVDWQDEQEYRWVYYDSGNSESSRGGDEERFADVQGAMAGLVLGADFANAHLSVAQGFADAHNLKGDIVKCLWDRLNLRLITFGENEGRLVPIPPARGRMHLSTGPVHLKPILGGK